MSPIQSIIFIRIVKYQKPNVKVILFEGYHANTYTAERLQYFDTIVCKYCAASMTDWYQIKAETFVHISRGTVAVYAIHYVSTAAAAAAAASERSLNMVTSGRQAGRSGAAIVLRSWFQRDRVVAVTRSRRRPASVLRNQ